MSRLITGSAQARPEGAAGSTRAPGGATVTCGDSKELRSGALRDSLISEVRDGDWIET